MPLITPCTQCGKKSLSFLLRKGICKKCIDINSAAEYQRTQPQSNQEVKSTPASNINLPELFSQTPVGYKPQEAPEGSVSVFIDVETTGLNPQKDAIVQVSAMRFFGDKAIDGISTYINPLRPIPAEVTKIHGITDDKVKYAPTIADIQEQFMDLIQGAVLVGYNARFDLDFLNFAFNGALEGVKYVDVLKAVRNILVLPNYRLETVATHLDFRPEGGFHDSTIDCAATAAVFFRLGLQELLKSAETYVLKKSPKNEYTSMNYTGLPFWQKGEELRKNGEFEAALEQYNLAKANGYIYPWLYVSYAQTFHRLKDYDSEIAALNEGIANVVGHEAGVEDLKSRRDKAIATQLKKQEAEREKVRKQQERDARNKAKELASANTAKKPVGRSVLQLDDNGTLINEFNTISSAAREVGVSTKCIRDAANGIQKHAGGFCWKYKDED